MRILLVDNHDSFTYNLVHQLARVTGEEPTVVRNDDPNWHPAMLADFDGVVISPGPGTPERAADFGICREIIERTELPLLGVCLGHQGIGLLHGARVGRAPEVRHGRTSPVLHEGNGLFAGLPSPFEAVRYHSLAVTGLPPHLEVTAWTPDGVVMGLRHRERPLWGVQFHPESICSEYGDELLANFCDLARTGDGHHRGTVELRLPSATAVPAAWTATAVPAPATTPATPAAASVPAGLAVPAAASAPSATAVPAARTATAAPAEVTTSAASVAVTVPAGLAVPAAVTGPAALAVPAAVTTPAVPTASTVPAAPAVPTASTGPAALAVPAAATAPAVPATPPPATGTAVPPPARSLRVFAVQVPTPCDDETLFQRLFSDGDHAYWLDSSRRDGQGRFSVMGDASGPLARVASADVSVGTVTVRSATSEEIFEGPFLDWLDRDLAALDVEVPPLPCDFALGWTGYLGYGLKAECEGPAGHRAEEPDAVMVFADRALVLDHETGTTHLLALAEHDDTRTARDWLDDTARRLAGLTGTVPAPPPGPPAGLGELRLRHSREGYLRLIDACQAEIAAGESYEICLTNMAEVRGTLDPWQGYRFLRRSSPAPFGALLQFGELSVLSTSPERFLRISADGVAESKPIKGTRPRGRTPEEDAALAADLRTHEKDRAENLMIVDLVRNDLGRCADIGTVRADPVFAVESYATVHQLVSTVTARLRPDSSPVRCLRAAFPPGSMTGAPKPRTLEIIDRMENGPRGVYSGAIGYLSLSGAADFSVVIRTAVVTPGRLRYGVGGAIVALSEPAEEFEETVVKAAPLLALTGTGFSDPRDAVPASVR
ncbi:aminodeoxychorismate synthase component I [Streptomyces sp. NPDC086787]|uniref:aminodeoxychorismate synthase component I n=1 Tax=Streptomyces sp. NPDC086787 TaxID=3365759 RepID=UPI00381BC538